MVSGRDGVKKVGGVSAAIAGVVGIIGAANPVVAIPAAVVGLAPTFIDLWPAKDRKLISGFIVEADKDSVRCPTATSAKRR